MGSSGSASTDIYVLGKGRDSGIYSCVFGQVSPVSLLIKTSITWQHHQAQHGCEKAKGMDKEARGCRNSRTAYNGNHGSQEAMDNAKGLRIGKNKEHQSAIEAVFNFQ
jgi:hypothetical protein